MNKAITDKIEMAISLLNSVLGYADATEDLDELRKKSMRLIFGGQSQLENKINNEGVKDGPLLINKEDDTMTQKYQYNGITISKHKQGNWWCRIQYKGTVKALYGKTIEEVKKKIKPAREELKKEYLIKEKSVKKYTFFEWLNFWNDNYKKPYNRTDSISAQLKKHVFNKTRDKPLEKVTTIELQILINQIEATRTRVDVTNILKNAFNTAVLTKILNDNPTTALIKVIHHSKKGKALTREEELKFLNDIVNHPLENLYRFYLLSGCRRSEALKLNISDVNFEEKTIHIKGTKTENSDRTIPMFDGMEKLLKTIQPKENGFYFECHEDTATQSFKKLCPAHKLHDLRHTFATRCLEAGISMKTVQIWLGHSTFEMTANTYSHVQKDFQSEQALRLKNYTNTVLHTVSNKKND